MKRLTSVYSKKHWICPQMGWKFNEFNEFRQPDKSLKHELDEFNEFNEFRQPDKSLKHELESI